MDDGNDPSGVFAFFKGLSGVFTTVGPILIIIIQTVRYLGGDGWEWVSMSTLFGESDQDIYVWNQLWAGFFLMALGLPAGFIGYWKDF